MKIMYGFITMRQVGKSAVGGRLALITLGSNNISPFGDATATVRQAMQEVENAVGAAARRSHLYATPAFPAGAGPDFVNAAMAVQTRISAADLLAILHGIEDAAGRERTVRWGPRTLDLDLIGLGDLVCPDVETQTRWRTLPAAAQTRETPDQLILPHPRVQDRSFALVPLSDVAPDWRHPVLGQTIADLCAARPGPERQSVVRLDAAPASGDRGPSPKHL